MVCAVDSYESKALTRHFTLIVLKAGVAQWREHSPPTNVAQV